MTRRRLTGLAGAVVFLGASVFAFGAPHLTLLNAGLRVDYGAERALAAFAAAAGATLAAWGAPRAGLRVLAGALALAALLLGLGRMLYRLEADADGLSCRELTGVTRIAWAKVSRVEQGPEVLVVWGVGDSQIRVETSGFRPDQRATLERTVSRRVREATGQ